MNPRVRTKVGEGGRIVIPAEFRRKMGICPGDTIVLLLDGEELRVFTVDAGIRTARAIVRQFVPEEVSLVDELIAERRAEAARE